VGWGLRMDANAGRAVHIETASRHVMEHWNKIMKRFSTACQGGGSYQVQPLPGKWPNLLCTGNERLAE